MSGQQPPATLRDVHTHADRTLVLHSSKYPEPVGKDLATCMTWEAALGGLDRTFVAYDRFVAFPVAIGPNVTHWKEAAWRLHTWRELAEAIRQGGAGVLLFPTGEDWTSDDPLHDVSRQTAAVLDTVCGAGPRRLHPLVALQRPAPLIECDGADGWQEHLSRHRPERELSFRDHSDRAGAIRPIAYLGNRRGPPVAASVRVDRGVVVLLPLRRRRQVDLRALLEALDALVAIDAAERIAEHDSVAFTSAKIGQAIDAPPARPSWERLRVLNDDIAELEGTRHRLRSRFAATFLRTLIEEKGAPIKADSLERAMGNRPRRIWEKLPPPIRAIVEPPGRGRIGYRLK